MQERIRKYENDILKANLAATDNLPTRDTDSDIEDIDGLLEELENEEDDFLSRYREQRMDEISRHLKEVERNVQEDNYGIVELMTDESELIERSTNTARIIIHFQLEHFEKCRIMNDRLDELAKKYLSTKFVKIEVSNCPFLVSKLNIKVLPLVVGYRNGLESTKLIGFSQLGNDSKGFPLSRLENILISSKLIKLFSQTERKPNRDDEDSDLDI
ncbi:Plp1p KNAG_0A04730 [Huiozyma naganishii CBS 8797]|uniref:Phosducin domain-containing protein n=1 Tax=Huiozyma naganishii (strain ATCC MYA-139 / BCRC 22969 / CBS 8797 / KCTC 17520 / NBRC 10181 / NCYC 3082 / Yp74L-3) TaxID=1071383 RepID=J7S2F2_HUIN7|nr:hypothetical protein KNAG_0A04730 [Kazachstania naganishii CBS 8797]CCK68144.1 hypothetical protein KNAG_0A04730 [Kazachstania naganishii CBS 8797]